MAATMSPLGVGPFSDGVVRKGYGVWGCHTALGHIRRDSLAGRDFDRTRPTENDFRMRGFVGATYRFGVF